MGLRRRLLAQTTNRPMRYALAVVLNLDLMGAMTPLYSQNIVNAGLKMGLSGLCLMWINDCIGGEYMIYKYLASFSILFLLLSAVLFAQDTDFQSNVDYKAGKMKKELNLTDSQVYAIKPIIKDYLIKRSAVLEGMSGQGIIDHVAVKSTLKGLKEQEYQKLSKILSEDQMKRWINKENLMASFNPDGGESVVDDGGTLTAEGANFKF
jgi:hypothetical protein